MLQLYDTLRSKEALVLRERFKLRRTLEVATAIKAHQKRLKVGVL